MAQPAVMPPNGTPVLDGPESSDPVAPGKRKRDSIDDGDGVDEQPSTVASEPSQPPARDQKELVKSCFDALNSFDVEPSILKRSLPDTPHEDEPDLKRQKSSEPASSRSISDKVAAGAYDRLSDMAADLVVAVKVSLDDASTATSTSTEKPLDFETVKRIREFKKKATALLRREEAYPQAPTLLGYEDEAGQDALEDSKVVLSLVGHAPQERRLFSSLASSDNIDLDDLALPLGISATRVVGSNLQERTPTLGELFAPPKSLPPLQPPKQPKTGAKGNMLDFYQPELIDKSQYRTNSYFSTRLSSGHYLDYSHATPTSSVKAKQHERAQSLAGKKPSKPEMELSEMEALFRGAFSSFAPCKDDSAAIVSSSTAGHIWWQKCGQQHFQNMIEIDYHGEDVEEPITSGNTAAPDIDEQAIQEAIENWDDALVDPTLEDIMGTKRDNDEKEVDEILDEVSDMIETLASYQRIRNLNLPNSQNRQTSDPVAGDMLATSGPYPSEEEQATYEMLKAQLALIIKTLPPYAIAKLNGDQLEDLLISTKIQVSTDEYKGVMEEDDTAAQARIRAQQAAQASARTQRTPSMSYANQYHQPNAQYATPPRPPAAQPQQYFRPGVTPNYQQNFQQQQRQFPASNQARAPQPNQYSRSNGYASQYATQLAKAQTPFGHQNMPQYQQRPQFNQPAQQQGTPNSRYTFQQQSYPQQQTGTPVQNYQAYTNGSGMHQQAGQQRMSPQIQHQQAYSPSPTMQNSQRYGTPGQGMSQHGNRYPSNSTGSQGNSNALGYHTVIPEAQQQRILEQAKARIAASERSSSMFTDKRGSVSGLSGMSLSSLANARASMGKPGTPTGQRPINGAPPSKVTPVPVPVIPAREGSAPTTPQPQVPKAP